MSISSAEIIDRLGLLPHPEGGFFKETYRSAEYISQNELPERFSGKRSIATAIYYLLNDNDFSGFHRIKSEETWHFYMGQAIELIIIDPQSNLSIKKLGTELLEGQEPQITVLANSWFSAYVVSGKGYSLVGCTVAPGFDFADFEMGKKNKMIELFPQHNEVISKYCRE